MYKLNSSMNMSEESAIRVLEGMCSLSKKARFALEHRHFFGTSERLDSKNYTFIGFPHNTIVWNGDFEKGVSKDVYGICSYPATVMKCDRCGRLYNVGSTWEISVRELDEPEGFERENARLCIHCLNDLDYSICHNCGEPVHNDSSSIVYAESIGENFCCRECAHEYGMRTCENCGELFNADDMYEDEEGFFFCSHRCATRYGRVVCEHCGESVMNNPCLVIGEYGNEEEWCSECEEWHSTYCESCGNYVSNMIFDHTEDMCESCVDEGGDYLFPYGYSPEIEFFGEYDGYHPFMGIELEIDSSSGRRSKMLSEMYGDPLMGKMTWCTRDSSLSEKRGIEVTSMPATLDEHLSCGIWEHLRECAVHNEYRSHDMRVCGLHIHINRAFFSKYGKVSSACGYKLLRLFQRHEQAFLVFSRRENQEWCHFQTRHDYSGKSAHYIMDESLFSKGQYVNRNEQNHSQVVNFQHCDTFEIRLFRGTLNLDTLYASMALCDGLARFVKTHSEAKCERINWYELMEWILADTENKQAHDALESYLLSKELIVAR